ncbi:hypothetical protein PF006_g7998 [Phytophthora fragariae]|uniref:Uncharacterized protein n=1 Tax=Phytophthora fragariae TaxID=53985 RepID=A0A6A3U700_9STRA|nr:hypothetical protein PF006_g7998 [Phytophthora fragariae]
MKSIWSERDVRILVQTTVPCQINEGSEAGSLQCLSCQLRVIEAKAEDILRRQEQHSQGQILVAWEMLLSKIDQVQETSLRFDLQHHTMPAENYASKLSAQVLEKLRNISKLRTPLEIALNRLSCPGLTCSPFQLKQDMEALTLELDELLGLIDSSVHASPVVSFDQPFGQTLLQTARLVIELGVEFKARMTIVNDNFLTG